MHAAGFIAGVTLRVGTVGNLYSLEQQCPALFTAGVPHAYGGSGEPVTGENGSSWPCSGHHCIRLEESMWHP